MSTKHGAQRIQVQQPERPGGEASGKADHAITGVESYGLEAKLERVVAGIKSTGNEREERSERKKRR